MKILFIVKAISISDPLGIMTLSSILKREGHQVYLSSFKKENILRSVEEIRPNIVAYSVTTGNQNEFLEINKEIKKRFKVLSVFGGPHPTFYPEIIQEEGIDAICIGEGDEAFPEFVSKVEGNKRYENTKNFWVKKGDKIIKNKMRNLVKDLDAIPFPDREIIYQKDSFLRDIKIKRFIASRGCPFKCTYCFNKQYNEIYRHNGQIIRRRSIRNVIQEIIDVKKRYPLCVVKFVDDTFNLNKEWLYNFCELYKKEINLPFICNLRADLVTEEMVKKLKEAGCIIVYMGIETGDEEMRKKILDRNMSNQQIINAFKLMKKYKIKTISQNILGLPGENVDYSFKTINLNIICKPDLPGFSIFQPYPGTALTEYAIEKDFFDGNFEKLYTSYLSSSSLNYTKYEKRQLENLYRLSIITVKFPFLSKIVKQLIKLPKNKIFDWIYLLSYGWSQWKIYSIISNSKIESLRLFKRFSEYVFKT